MINTDDEFNPERVAVTVPLRLRNWALLRPGTVGLRNWFTSIISVCGAMLLLGGAGCSTFNRDWKTSEQTVAQTNDIQGRWEGTWLSQTKGHHGSLRCLLTRETDYQYEARFHATYWKVFRFGYAVQLIATPADGAYQFRGDADLGWLAGGTYHYEGTVTPTNFFSTYRAAGDHGIFQMHRP